VLEPEVVPYAFIAFSARRTEADVSIIQAAGIE
jgi:hypothetical protein